MRRRLGVTPRPVALYGPRTSTLASSGLPTVFPAYPFVKCVVRDEAHGDGGRAGLGAKSQEEMRVRAVILLGALP